MFTFTFALLTVLCIAGAFYDIRKQRIPDSIIVSGVFLKIISSLLGYCFYNEDPVRQAISLLAGLIISLPVFLVSYMFKQIAGKPAFGGGDIKLLFMCGLFFMPGEAIWLLVLTLVFAAIAGIEIHLFTGSARQPFAPSVLAALLCFICFNCQGRLFPAL